MADIGGFAFPSDDGPGHGGLDFIDYMAARAMEAMIVSGNWPLPHSETWQKEGYDGAARRAYDIAAAMLKESRRRD